MTRYALDPTTPVLSRPDGTVQIGWDPRRAVAVCPPSGMATTVLADLLRALQGVATVAGLQTLAEGHGTDPALVAGLVAHLLQRGIVSAATEPPAHSAAVRLHGGGPLSDLLTSALRCSGVRISHSSRTHAVGANVDLAVLTDYLVADPRVVRDLHDAGVPHLPVRVRDGAGLVGPLVLPGVTSCLRCADLHRSDRDAAWPAIAWQLCRTVGSADRPTLLATAALALREVNDVLRALGGGSGGAGTRLPSTLDTTLEIDVGHGIVAARSWSRHPKCPC
ncbi:cyclodehydratase [Mycobacterium sp. Y57]|uniref:cyclodehydratase n=1 Tax=Mycolicibacterium xanthum TaxID=2796469 RepID=UPI001C85DE4B|nr:cyclodehydratase [Mycolicibacterium xanthum]MBX7434922.1 cyclodehydratase [Mycolicibacterium xanthum]